MKKLQASMEQLEKFEHRMDIIKKANKMNKVVIRVIATQESEHVASKETVENFINIQVDVKKNKKKKRIKSIRSGGRI